MKWIKSNIKFKSNQSPHKSKLVLFNFELENIVNKKNYNNEWKNSVQNFKFNFRYHWEQLWFSLRKSDN